MTQTLEPRFTREEWIEFAWSKNAPDLSDDSRKVLEEYSKVPGDEVVAHVSRIREKAFSIFPYPCIGQWRFLQFALGRHPRYQEVLQRMLSGDQVFLDLGCAFAQDVRRLVADGVDSSQCYGTDLRLQFLDLGYELFHDKDSLKTKFIEGDIFAKDNPLDELHGKVDIINSSSFFHLFPLNEQKDVARRCVKLWKSGIGTLLVGRHVGSEKAADVTSRAGGSHVYRHNVESWQHMWDEIAAETGEKLKVESVLVDMPSHLQAPEMTYGRQEGTKLMVFSVEKLVRAHTTQT